MAVITVNDDVLHSREAQEYYSRADSRVMIGLRFALEALDIPIPDYARRKPPGRPPSRLVKAAASADQGVRERKDYGPAANEEREAYLLRRKIENARARIERKRAED